MVQLNKAVSAILEVLICVLRIARKYTLWFGEKCEDEWVKRKCVKPSTRVECSPVLPSGGGERLLT